MRLAFRALALLIPLLAGLPAWAQNLQCQVVSGALAFDVGGFRPCTQTTGGELRVSIAAGSNIVGAVTQSGTWTVQPGNTANTTAWLVTGTGGTFPATQSGTWNVTNISGTVSLPTGAATAANQTSEITALGAPADAAYAGSGSASIIAAVKGVFGQFATAAGLAEGASAPTTTRVGAVTQLYNGTTFDFQHANENVSLGLPGSAQTTSFQSAAQTNRNARGAYIYVNVSAVSGTGPSMSATLQFSPDGGTTWVTFGSTSASLSAAGSILFLVYPTNTSITAGATPANMTTNATSLVSMNMALPRTWRITFAISGTSPSFTIFSGWASYIL